MALFVVAFQHAQSSGKTGFFAGRGYNGLILSIHYFRRKQNEKKAMCTGSDNGGFTRLSDSVGQFRAVDR